MLNSYSRKASHLSCKIKLRRRIFLVTDRVIYNHFISFLKYIWNNKIIFQVLFHFFYKSNYELPFITTLRFLCYIIHLILTNMFVHSKEDRKNTKIQCVTPFRGFTETPARRNMIIRCQDLQMTGHHVQSQRCEFQDFSFCSIM